MSALDRIREIEKDIHPVFDNDPNSIWETVDVKFLLLAFQKMREIAIVHYDTLENHTRHDDSPMLVDREFEEAMKEGEKQ